MEVSTTLVDADSGEPIRGVDAKALLGSPVRIVTLAPGSSLGEYIGSLGPLPVGPTHLELKVRSVPGAEAVVPYDEGWDFTLTTGRPVQVTGEAVNGGSNIALTLSVSVAVILLSVLYGLLRRRTAGPAASPGVPHGVIQDVTSHHDGTSRVTATRPIRRRAAC